jgi:hypothetical protein
MTKTVFLWIFSILICLQASALAQKKNLPPKVTNVALNKVSVIKEGVGIEGLVVGKSTMKDVEKKFGKDYNWIVNKKYSYQMTYPKLGLSFYMCQSDPRREIFVIEIKAPYQAKTSRGVVLRQSTVEDIERIYGKLKSGLEYRGISFYYNRVGGKRIVTTIDVTENAGIRQCRENK